MKPKIHYIVRHAKPFLTDTGQLDYEIFEKVFLSPEPIEARKSAFSFYADYQTILDEAKDANGSDFSIAGLEARTNWEIENPDKAEKLTNSPYQAEVVLLIDSEEFLAEREFLGNEIKIHFKIFENSPNELSELMSNLDEESQIYHKFGLDTQNEEIEVPFWDYEAYHTYVHERNIWKEEFFSPEEEWAKKHTILKTPFDWSPYAKENWWNDFDYNVHFTDHRLEKREREKIINHKSLIEGGESRTVEFKTLMFSPIDSTDNNGNRKMRNMQLEVAETIGSLLNTHGGSIYIGVKDNGQIIGVNLENRTRDQYRRSFTKLKEDFFSHQSNVVYRLVKGDFISVDRVELFLITVEECEEEPVYLYNKEKPFGTAYQFFVRQEASSNLLYDAPRLVKYIEDKWWKNKYTKNEE